MGQETWWRSVEPRTEPKKSQELNVSFDLNDELGTRIVRKREEIEVTPEIAMLLESRKQKVIKDCEETTKQETAVVKNA
jgi:hypothetical protein